MERGGVTGTESTDIQARVLQSTLHEVSNRKPHSDGAQSDCCVICLDVITEPCEARPCQHTNYDFVCLINWLEQQPKCPLCKSLVTEVRYDYQGTDEQAWKTFVPRQTAPSVAGPEATHGLRPRPPRRNWPYYTPSRRRDRPSPLRTLTEDEAVIRRRQVYRDQLYSLHVGTNRVTQYRELTPQLFELDPNLVSRARMWLRRELKVFSFLHAPADSAHASDDAMTRRRANNAEFLLEYIIAILKTVDIQGSQGQAEDMLQEFLGRDNTRLLLHELKSFLRSPFVSLEAWDRSVQYPSAAPMKQRSASPEDGSRPGSSSSVSRSRQLEDASPARPRGDSYRPHYEDGGGSHVGSARRSRPP